MNNFKPMLLKMSHENPFCIIITAFLVCFHLCHHMCDMSNIIHVPLWASISLCTGRCSHFSSSQHCRECHHSFDLLKCVVYFRTHPNTSQHAYMYTMKRTGCFHTMPHHSWYFVQYSIYCHCPLMFRVQVTTLRDMLNPSKHTVIDWFQYMRDERTLKVSRNPSVLQVVLIVFLSHFDSLLL